MPLRTNSILNAGDPAVDLTRMDAPTVHRRPAAAMKRSIRDARRVKTAAEVIGPLDKETEVYGFTKGQFSIVDIIQHCLLQTGPARLDLFTWTSANTEISTILALLTSNLLTDSRWVVDLSFNRREPALAARIREVFGADAIRVAKNHAKFFLIGNEEWKVVIRTSMNLNFNPRFENFQVAHDPDLYAFHDRIFQEIWNRQPNDLASQKPYDIQKHFNADL